jgi:hypothetical protein
MSDDLLQRVVPPPEPAGPGFRLRAAREARGLSYQDVEAATRIRARYLEALETGKYDVMPGGEAQVRGFLRRYATFLNIPPEEIIALYERETHRAAALHLPPACPGSLPCPPTVPGPCGSPASPGTHRRTSAAHAISAGPAGADRGRRPGGSMAGNAPGAGVPRLPAHADGGRAPPGVAFPSPMATATPAIPAPPTSVPTPAATPTFPVSTNGVTLTLEAREHVWVRVTVDGFTAFEGMLSPGAPQTWVGQEMVIVETGNGAGVVAVVNGQSQGPLCGRGEVCARGWGPEGEIPVSP